MTLDEVWSTHNGCEIEIDEENNGEKLIVKLEEKKMWLKKTAERLWNGQIENRRWTKKKHWTWNELSDFDLCEKCEYTSIAWFVTIFFSLDSIR